MKKFSIRMPLLFFFLVVFILINARDLNSWYYSVIGDEYGFYQMAKNLDREKLNIFSMSGVYGYHPVLSSYYQFFIMKTFGMDDFGWRLSSLLVMVSSLLPFYLLVKNLFDEKVAFVSSIFFINAFYFWAYAHTGYNNLQAIFPFVMSIWLALAAIKNRKTWLFLLSGLFAGLGWYTFFTARITVFLVNLLFFIVLLKNKKIKKGWLFKCWSLFMIAFLLTLLPVFKNEGLGGLVKSMREQSVLNNSFRNVYFEKPLLRWWENFKINFFNSWWGGITQNKHFLTAPLVDPATRCFIVVGLGVLLIKMKNWKNLFLLISLMLSMIMVSFNPIKEIVVSRLHLSLLILTIVAGKGFDFLLQKIKRRRGWVLGALYVFLLLLNMNIFFKKIPKTFALNKESLIIKKIQESKIPVVIYEGQKKNQSFREIVEAYALDKKVRWFNDQEEKVELSGPFWILNNQKTEKVDAWKEEFIKKCQQARMENVFDLAEKTSIEVFYCQ